MTPIRSLHLLWVGALLAGCGDARLEAPEGDLAQAPLAAPEAEDSAPPAAPFAAAPVAAGFAGAPAPVDFDSHPLAGRFRSALTEGAARGPNFAGDYTVVSWGCGTMCQQFMIIDARTGEVFDGRTAALGVEHRLDSRLLVLNPPERQAEAQCAEAHCATQYLIWDGERLEPVLDDGDREQIRRAALDYVRDETAVAEATVEILAVAEGWARVLVVPANEVTDPATMYLRKEESRWVAVVLGTGFAPEDYEELGIPPGVRPQL